MNFEIISAKNVSDYIGREDTLIIDVRDTEEYNRGHIPTAVNIPFDEIDKYKYDFYKYDTLILYCERGNQSLIKSRELSKLGYHVKNIYGGMNAYEKIH